ncbi:hypothetical protein [Siccirubricoccus phaeus]|uniref:hypothetical protein n=1 Tax=Siccirubricoccus phaeus TaxID=2595053 RepID=UPI0011F40449|nr:hypothetical protein [Siccirubricoccus phaeus]
MPANTTQTEWVRRVLGIGPAGGASAQPNAPTGPASPALPVWREAKEAVDAQIDALAKALRGYGHPDLDRIADLGLYGIGAREGVGIMRALLQFDAASAEGRAQAAKAVRSATAAWRALLAGNKVVALIDRNPEVPVTMQATLGRALDDIDSILDRAA